LWLRRRETDLQKLFVYINRSAESEIAAARDCQPRLDAYFIPWYGLAHYEVNAGFASAQFNRFFLNPFRV